MSLSWKQSFRDFETLSEAGEITVSKTALKLIWMMFTSLKNTLLKMETDISPAAVTYPDLKDFLAMVWLKITVIPEPSRECFPVSGLFSSFFLLKEK